jgi:tetratricopeptide (TPR) repeat protein
MLWIAFIVALATAEPSASAREEAGAAFRTATEHFAEEDYEAALAKFREAYRLAPHDKVRFNIGQCLSRLGRWHEAWVELEAAARSEQLSEGERSIARTAADDAASHLTAVAIDPAPPEPPRVPPPTVVTPPPAPAPIEDRAPPRARPSALTWVGLGLAVGGGAGIIGFGVRANALHDDYIAGPDPATRDKGITMRNLANASIAVALVGAVLITADAIRIGVARRRSR